MKTAKDVMTRRVVSVKPHDRAHGALVQILAGHYSGMPVVNERNEVVGVVSEFDLVKSIQKGLSLEKVLISEIMTPKPYTVDVSERMDKVTQVMIDKSYLRIPVTENGKLAGVISRGDILKSYYDSEPIDTSA